MKELKLFTGRTRKEPQPRESQSGVNIIFLAIFMFVLMGLLGLAFGAGFMVLNNIKYQNTANAAALAALNAYLEQPTSQKHPQSSSIDQGTRIQKAESAALSVFSTNSFYRGREANSGEQSQSFSTPTLEFGSYYTSPPPGVASPCATYPCYIKNTDPIMGANLINSVKIVAQSNDQDNFVAPFAKAAGFLPGGQYFIHKEAVAVALPKCMAVLLDVGDASVKDTHEYSLGNPNYTVFGGGSGEITYPLSPGAFAYDEATIGIDCSTINRATHQLGAYWCDLQMKLPHSTGLNFFRAASDYRQPQYTRRGVYYADLYTRPEPLTTYVNSINGVLKDFAKNISVQDRVVAYVFDDMKSPLTPTGFVDRIPAYGTGSNSFLGDNNVGFMTQLFNIGNIGTVDGLGNYMTQPVHPNMLDRGWFPNLSDATLEKKSNLPVALRQAMGEMNSYCLPNSAKSIVVASSGVFKEAYVSNGTTGYNILPINTFADYTNFIENKMLKRDSNGGTGWDESILYDALRWDVSISFLVGGKKIGTNFCNRKISGSQNFLAFNQMYLDGNSPEDDAKCNGQRALAETSNEYPTNNTKLPVCKDDPSECAYKNFEHASLDASNPSGNSYFRYPQYYLAKLAYESEGVFCPLLTRVPSSVPNAYTYDNVPVEEQPFTPKQLTTTTSPYARQDDAPQLWRVEDLSDIAAGADCIRSMTTKPKAYLVK